MTLAILAGTMALPVGEVDASFVKKANTHKTFPMGEEEPVVVHAYKEDGEWLHVPRQWGIEYCRSIRLGYEDATSRGVPFSTPRVPIPRDYQVPVLDEVVSAADGYYDFMFRARTGFGKTISALLVATRLGMSTLVVVDQENLKDQWLDALATHFGVAREDVGVIQGKKRDLRPVTIAMVQTLSRLDLTNEERDYFGLVIVDEVHMAGAPTFSLALNAFSATVRIGVSATPKRKDGLQRLLESHLGKVRVYVADAHDSSSLWIRTSSTVYSWYANSSPKAGRYLSEVSEDASRNLDIAEVAKLLVDGGRDTLVLSDRIEQLTHLASLCYYLGVPEDDIGVYVGSSLSYGYTKDANPSRRPLYLERGAEYTPVELKLISRKTPKATLTRIKDNARLIFATYSMFAKGVDVARLSGGVDATPRSDSEQMHGRILRIQQGKPSPIWVTYEDECSYRSLHQLSRRIPDYLRNNATIHRLNSDWSTTPCHPDELLLDLKDRVARLKTAQIETPFAGLNTLRFPVSLTERGGKAGSGIRLSRAPRVSSRTESPSPLEPNVKSPTRTPIIRSRPRPTPSPSSRRR